jgi:hypothetical protein
MVDKGLFRNERTSGARVSAHGSSLYRVGDTLDEERAASMADEGGASGAVTDALEQAGSTLQESLSVRRARQLPAWVPWAAATLGLASVFLLWARRR